MKMNRKFRQFARKRFWAGLLLLVTLACAECWMVGFFGRDCARGAAQADWGYGFPLSDHSLALR